MVGSESAAHILNVHSLATAREADQVGEQHRHDLALFALRHFAGRQLRATCPAEAEAVWVPLTTRGADRHRSSLGPHRGKRPAPPTYRRRRRTVRRSRTAPNALFSAHRQAALEASELLRLTPRSAACPFQPSFPRSPPLLAPSPGARRPSTGSTCSRPSRARRPLPSRRRRPTPVSCRSAC